LSDYELIVQIKKSNKGAFDQLFRLYYKPLCRFAWIICHDSALADDIVQSFFIKIWEQRDKLIIPDNVKTYCFVSVRNIALNEIKKDKTRNGYENTVTDSMYEAIDVFDSERFKKHLENALKQLPEQCRLIYSLKNIEGLTIDEIACYLEISSKTVEGQISIALRKLREILMKHKHEFFG
jgi:RNA polymerase sigma-70 factor (ECF subfamily)